MNRKRALASFSLPKLLADPSAKRAVKRLVSKGATQGNLGELLGPAVIATQLSPLEVLAVEGMTRRGLGNFPNEIRRIARAMELVGQNPFLDPKPELQEVVKLLPGVLRLYAADLERTIRAFRHHLQKNPRYFDLERAFKLKLLRYVEAATGQPRFAWVADLLNAAYSVAAINTYVEVSALRKLHKRQRAKPSVAS